MRSNWETETEVIASSLCPWQRRPQFHLLNCTEQNQRLFGGHRQGMFTVCRGKVSSASKLLALIFFHGLIPVEALGFSYVTHFTERTDSLYTGDALSQLNLEIY